MTSEFEGKYQLITVRPMAETDLGFIYSTWLKGLYYGNDWFREINQDIFFKCYHRVIERILSRPSVEVTVACLKDDQDVILGYSVTEASVLHFIFVKDAWRKMGLGRDLIPAEVKSVTHLTKVGRSIKPRDWDFNPFLV